MEAAYDCSLALKLWGIFLLLLGAGLVIFNRPYSAWASKVALPASIPVAIGRLLTVAVGLVMAIAGVMALVH